MADSVTGTSSSAQVSSNYEKYKDFFAKSDTNNLGQSDFLKLMTEQMKNQDFMNPTDNAQYIAQLAQFSSLQQMQQITYYSNASFATSLVGKTVTMASMDGAGAMDKVTDVVSSIRFNGQAFEIMVGGKAYTTSNLMEIVSGKTDTKPEETKDETPST